MPRWFVKNLAHLQALFNTGNSIVTVRPSALIAFLAVILAPAATTLAQDQVILRDTLDASFGTVWSSMQESMAEMACGKAQTNKVIEPEDELGFYKGQYISDFCMLATGEDTTADYMEQFGDLPRIRGGIWITGRIQYKVNVKEIGVRQTVMILRAELSGFEEFITNRVYFWTSNGILERQMRDAIVAKVAAKTDE